MAAELAHLLHRCHLFCCEILSLEGYPGKGQERSQRDTRGHSWPKKVPKVLLIPTLERQTLYFRKEIAGYLNRDVRTAGQREKEKRDMLFLGFAFGLLLLRPIHPEQYRAISLASVNAGHAAHRSRVSLPYKTTPICFVFSRSRAGLE